MPTKVFCLCKHGQQRSWCGVFLCDWPQHKIKCNELVRPWREKRRKQRQNINNPCRHIYFCALLPVPVSSARQPQMTSDIVLISMRFPVACLRFYLFMNVPCARKSLQRERWHTRAKKLKKYKSTILCFLSSDNKVVAISLSRGWPAKNCNDDKRAKLYYFCCSAIFFCSFAVRSCDNLLS